MPVGRLVGRTGPAIFVFTRPDALGRKIPKEVKGAWFPPLAISCIIASMPPRLASRAVRYLFCWPETKEPRPSMTSIATVMVSAIAARMRTNGRANPLLFRNVFISLHQVPRFDHERVYPPAIVPVPGDVEVPSMAVRTDEVRRNGSLVAVVPLSLLDEQVDANLHDL